MPIARGRARGRFPLREPAYKPPVRRRRPPAQPLAQTIAVGLVTETDAAFAVIAAVSAGTDTFERPDGTLGEPWLAWTTTMPELIGGAAYDGGTLGDATYSIAASSADWKCEAILESAITAGGTENFGVGVRLTAHSASADGYTFEAQNTGTGVRGKIYKGSGFVTVATSAVSTYTSVDGLRITAVGSTIKGFLRVSGVWTEVVSATDSTYTAAGYPGFWVQDPASGADVGIEQVSWGPATAITQGVGQATETDAAFTPASRKAKTVGLLAETSLAQAVTRVKARALGIASETDTASAVAHPLRRAVNQAVETDTAQQVTGGNMHRTGAMRSLPLGARGRHRGRFPLRGPVYRPAAITGRVWSGSETGLTLVTTVNVGQAAETDAALNLIAGVKVISVGQATETDAVFAVRRARRYRSGFPYPVDTVLAGPFIVVAQATETEAALAATHRKTRAVGQALDTEIAQSVAALGSKVVNVGQAAEADTALAATRRKTKAVGLNAETETAQATTRRKTVTLGQAVETGTAQVIRPARIKAVGLAVEAEASLTATRVKSHTLGQPLEFESAQSHTRRKVKALGLTVESDEARPVTIIGADVIVVERAAETDTAQPVGRAKLTTIGLPQGNETAFPVTRLKTITVTQATETDLARPIDTSPVFLVDIGIAAETDMARRIVRFAGGTTYDVIVTGHVRPPRPGTARGGQPGTARKAGVLVP